MRALPVGLGQELVCALEVGGGGFVHGLEADVQSLCAPINDTKREWRCETVPVTAELAKEVVREPAMVQTVESWSAPSGYLSASG